MRTQRYPWETIAQTLGYKSADTARKSVSRYTKRLPMESIETLRQTELDGLDLAESALAERIRAGELRAIETMLKIKHQRARLTGLYAAGLDTALDSELVAIQTTIHALRMAK